MKNIRSISIWILCFLNSLKVFSGSVVGGDLTYQFLGNDQYLVSLNLIRDCSGSSAPLSLTLNVSSSTCASTQTYTLLPIPGTSYELTFGCPTNPTTCNGGNAFGAQLWQYSSVVTLPAHCPDWIFSVQDSSRADSLTTISPNQDFYFEAALNNVGQDNSTPSFSIAGLFIANAFQTQFFNQGSIDADGDSLVYYFVDARINSNSPVNYTAGYSGQSPLSSTPPATIDQVTGDISIHSPIRQFAVAAVHIDEYRNGNLIAYTERNIGIYVDTFPVNTAPALITVWPQTIIIEANVPFCFNVASIDPDPGDTITMTYNTNGMPGATFTVTGTPFPLGTFCWTPADSDTSMQGYYLAISVRDNACPVNALASYAFQIIVSPFTGIKELTENNVYLFEDKLTGTFLINSGKLIAKKVRVHNSTGVIVFDQNNISAIDLNNFSAGIYFAEIVMNDNRKVIRKIIKQ